MMSNENRLQRSEVRLQRFHPLAVKRSFAEKQERVQFEFSPLQSDL